MAHLQFVPTRRVHRSQGSCSCKHFSQFQPMKRWGICETNVYIFIYVYMYMYTYIYIYVYTYIERERGRERERYNIYIYIYNLVWWSPLYQLIIISSSSATGIQGFIIFPGKNGNRGSIDTQMTCLRKSSVLNSAQSAIWSSAIPSLAN